MNFFEIDTLFRLIFFLSNHSPPHLKFDRQGGRDNSFSINKDCECQGFDWAGLAGFWDRWFFDWICWLLLASVGFCWLFVGFCWLFCRICWLLLAFCKIYWISGPEICGSKSRDRWLKTQSNPWLARVWYSPLPVHDSVVESYSLEPASMPVITVLLMVAVDTMPL